MKQTVCHFREHAKACWRKPHRQVGDMEAGGGIEPPVADLQSAALPLCYPAIPEGYIVHPWAQVNRGRVTYGIYGIFTRLGVAFGLGGAIHRLLF